MTRCPVLPAELQTKLASLARRIRLLRLVRGIGLTTLTLVLLFAVVFALDLWLELSPRNLLIALIAVGAVTVIALVRFVIMPLCGRLDAAALASLIDHTYPALRERLLSTVELAGARDPGFGSPALIAALRGETVDQARTLDVRPSYPAQMARGVGVAALVAVVIAMTPAFTWETYAQFSRRFWTAWQDRPPFDVRVDCIAFAAKGRPLTLSARLVPDGPTRRLPDRCTLLYKDGYQTVRRLPMQPTADHQFTYTISQVQGDFQFQIEAGPVLSEVHIVQAIEAVDVTEASPHVTIVPPPYVNTEVHPPQELTGVRDWSALQFSAVRVDVRFTRPAFAARFHLEAGERKEQIPLTMSADRDAAKAELPVLDPGSYALRLTMEAEHRIVTVRDLGTLRIWSDGPPRFVEIPRLLRGGTEPVSASPEDVLPLRVAVEDDVGIDSADVEYQINGGPIQRENIFRANGRRQAARDARFHLSGKAKDGDRVQLRLRASDNRLLLQGTLRDAAGRAAAAADLRPHVIYEPPASDGQERWLEINISRTSVARHEKDVGDRDLVDLERLARREEDLAKRTAGLADRKDNPKANAELADIKAEHQHVLDELQRLLQKSAMFKEALQARQNPAQPLAQQALRLAQEQRDLAKLIRRRDLADAAKELALLADKQQALAKKMKQLEEDLLQAKAISPPPRLAADAAEQAARALREGERAAALERQDLSLKSLEALAQRLEAAGSPAGDPRRAAEQLVKTQAGLRKRLEKLAADFATLKPEEVTRALKDIEREQHGLRDAVAKLAVPKDNVAAEKQRKAAVEVTGRAAELLKRRDALQAFEQMEKAQEALEGLRDALPVRKDPPPAPKSAEEKTLREQMAQAKQLAKEQQALREATAALSRKLDPAALSPQDSARQNTLRQQTQRLAQELEKLARQAGSEAARQAAKQAMAAAEKAGASMQQVETEAQQGHEEPARQAAEAAAKLLDEARARVAEAEVQFAKDKKSAAPAMDKLGESLQKAESQAGRGMQHLEHARPAQAASAMQQSASALQQAADAAEQLSQSRRSTPASQAPARGAGSMPVLPKGALPKEYESLSGRAWGELPGELRTRLLQDMQSRYGEDFARIIQGYFESLAEPPRPKK